MMMRRSSSAPLATTHHGHRRRASDSPPSPLTAPSCAPAVLRRHCSCSTSSTGSSPSIAAAALPPPAPPAPSPPTEPPSDDLSTPRITFGTFDSSVVDASTPILTEPEPISMNTVVAAPPPSPPRPSFTTNITPFTSLPPPAPPALQAEEKTEDAPKKALGTGPGTCMVCLEDCEDVIGSAWLHRRPSTAAAEGGKEVGKVDGVDECGVTACAACLKTYFTGVVEAGFDGACPRMRCMCCPRVVCERSWAPLVEPEVLETFRKRAATLLSIQCGMCHSRGTIMVVPPADHSYSSAVQTLMVEVSRAIDSKKSTSADEAEKTVNGTSPTAAAAVANTTATAAVVSVDTAVLDADSKADSEADLSAENAAELQETFLAELGLYASGNQVDVSPCYAAFEGAFRNPEVGEMDQDSRNSLTLMLMGSVEDSERRASLHIRFIRSNPMVTTKCCKALHCFRCRVVGGHAPLTCDQYEAQRGHEDVCKCPGCGVYVVKGDGCNAITCICGHNFGWDQLVRDRNRRVADAFRDAYPDNTERLAAEIIRRGRPEDAGTGAGEQAPPAATAAVAAAPGCNGSDGAVGTTIAGGRDVQGGDETAGNENTPPSAQGEEVEGREETAQLPASTAAADNDGWGPAGVGHADGWEEEWVQDTGGWGDEEPSAQELVPETTREPAAAEVEREEAVLAGNRPLSAEDGFRLASAYAQAYPREIARARAEVYGEENPHFTVQRARVQRDRGNVAQALSRYTGRPPPVAPPLSDAEAEWQATAAASWLTENRFEVSTVERREAAARSSLVEAFYGDASLPGRNTAIAHTAAEHARAALRVATPMEAPLIPASNQHNPEEDESLFKWLGIVEPPPPPPPPSVPGDGDGSPWDGEGTAEDEDDQWTLPFANYEIEDTVPEVILAPSSLWTPWPRGRLAPSRPKFRGRTAAADPATRAVSAVATFGSVPMQREVERWVAGADSRQEQLRKLMAVQERELSKAWVALWGRRLRFDPSAKTWVGNSGGDDVAVRSAARRLVFLEDHPEQACREQAAMMKAFVRRNGAAVAEARKASDAELAAAWEKLHGTEISLPTMATATATAADATPSTSMLSHAHDAYLRHVEAKTAAALAADSTSPASVAATLDLRRTGRMADAWMSKNRSWVAGRRFADRFVGQDGGSNAAAVAAVAALVVAPMLLRRSPLMCDCGMDSVCSDAVDWVNFNQEGFEKELERVDGKMCDGAAGEAGEGRVSRAIEGCECPEREGSLSCARLVACPVVTRRILMTAEPVCTACEEEDDFLGGELFDLFS